MPQKNENTREPASESPDDSEDDRPSVQLPEQRIKKDPGPDKDYGVVKQGKNAKSSLHLTVWPEGAGNPYPLEVEPDSKGWFYLTKKKRFDLSDHRGVPRYRIRPGSVILEDGRYKAWVKEGYYETLDPRDLGKGPHPDQLDDLISAEIVAEIEDSSRRGPTGWQKAGIVSTAVIGLALIGVLIWGIISIGTDLAGIKTAIEGLDFSQLANQGGAGNASTHQPIAPE